MSAEMFAGLLGTLRSIPPLPGARCRGNPSLWDDVDDPDPAVTTCLNHCPALAACRAWAHAQRPGTLHGVVAGDVHHWTPSRTRPRKAA
jgi:hypothetical protein